MDNFSHISVKFARFARSLDTYTIVAIKRIFAERIMQEIYSSITFEIKPGETVPMRVARSTRLAVQGACIWVTRSDDVEDYWLAPGRSLRLRRGERLWLSADGRQSARVAFLVAARPKEEALHWFARLGERFGARFRDVWRTV
jgi:hypothetical protein